MDWWADGQAEIEAGWLLCVINSSTINSKMISNLNTVVRDMYVAFYAIANKLWSYYAMMFGFLATETHCYVWCCMFAHPESG